MSDRIAGFAVTPVRFGDRVIEPGDPVPYERGRNYRMMIRLGQMAPYRDPRSARAAADGPARGKRSARAAADE